ncbi:HET-domain-containing protein [Curvularia clavata]|uniref:HET-domain-containing protein n=1 Tax=Curvularia clavata TaxID=95742 RepID=A0A9Q8ZCF8_CURCL|nr:HET-domain-containing protein [Curvularia clavata]
MPSIYDHAKLTIVAAVESANDPLPRWNKCHHKVSVPTELIRGIAHTIGEPPLVTALTQTTWIRRGWTFQEAFSARRLLVFTQDLIYWSCHEESWCEDQYTEFHNVKNEPTPETSLFLTSVWENSCNGNKSVTKLCAMGLYVRHAQDYSQRLFSNYSDVVKAFIGILKAMKEYFPNGYIWALPYDKLDAALLWLTCCEKTEFLEHQCDLSPESRLPIPSWSWIGKGHKVEFRYGICETKSRITWHEPVKCWSSNTDTVDHDQELRHLPQASVMCGPQTITEDGVTLDYAFLHFTAQTAMLSIELEPDPRNLEIFNAYIRNEQANSKSHQLVAANIFLSSKKAIGQILVPAHMFQDSTQQLQEFVLLSEYPGRLHNEVLNNKTRPVEGQKPGKSFDRDRHDHDSGSSHQEEEEACGIEDEKHQNQEFVDANESLVPEGRKDGFRHHSALNVMLIEWDEMHDIKNFARRVGIARIDPSAWEEVEKTEKTIILG